MDMLTCTRCDMNCPVPDRFQGLGSHQYDPCDRCQQELELERKRAAEAAIRADERAKVVAFARAESARHAKHRHHPYGDGCDDCGREKALDEFADAIEAGEHDKP